MKTEIHESQAAVGTTAMDSPHRRDFIHVMATSMAATGAVVAAWPFIDSLNPSADTLAVATVDLRLGAIAVGERVTVKWQGKPVFVARRTEREIAEALADDKTAMRDPATDATRVIRPEWLIVIGICTHLGCVPLGQRPSDPRGDWDGWFCPCHGSQYDTAGRIRKGPAPRNLDLPPYRFLSDTLIRIG